MPGAGRGRRAGENQTVVGLQWGDEGKGKLVDYLADRHEAVVRFNGGSNAGHTVVIGNEKFVFHLVPSGALKGKRLLIGPGVALDPLILQEEMTLLRKGGVEADLGVDSRCTLVSPLEKELDAFLESLRENAPLGTTRRGIGPSYAMRALRLTPRAEDIFGGFDFGPASRYYSRLGLAPEGLRKWVVAARKALRGLLGDVGAEVDEVCEAGGSVLFEASQGTLLDILHGTYPHVTSTQTLATYAAPSLGVAAKRTGRVLGVAKCYTTRVGEGPFPSEIRGPTSVSIREIGAEYGATTGRPRRVGWLDLVSLKYTTRLNGLDSLALTKVDVLAKIKGLKVCVAYRHRGSETTDFRSSMGHLGEVEPVYEELDDLFGSDFKSGSIPSRVKRFVAMLEERLGVRVGMVSYGEERSKTIEL